MILFIVIFLSVLILAASIYFIRHGAPKNSPADAIAHSTSGYHTPSPNPGSIPDPKGTKGDGHSALSSGQQG
jgi:hypothetical protein